MRPELDDEQEKDSILEHLQGEVDDYAGEQLPDDEKPEDKSAQGGVEISIIVTPKAGGGSEQAGEENASGEEGEDHDDIAHALGMHDGGCTY